MAQDDEPGSEDGSGGGEAKATEGQAPGDAIASAETRVLDEEAPSIEMTEGPVPASEAATILAEEDDDRTQLVDLPGTDGNDSDPAAPTRVMNPSAGPSGSAPSAAGGQVDTRVLDDADKTTPPPVIPSSERASRPPPRPTPIDPARGLAPGTILFGEYEIVNVLGVGGMGEVYRAHHRRLDEHRAIKVMHAELSNKKGASEFFYREAKALLAVRHPAVVHCHDLLSDDQGRVYLIMEMIEGIPLSTKMNDGPLSPDDVAILGARVSHGLSAAHRKGVIHRDVSPDNIVLPNGRVQEAKLIDFGIAKILQEGEGTIVDGFKGKLSYASPEQLGFFGGKIDGRSDFYSLGLVLVAAALGRPIPMGTSVMEAVDARRSLQGLPDAIPVGLRSAIQPLLALDPKDRPKYVDRLFVVPGGIDVDHDSEAFQRGAMSVGAATPSETSVGRTGLMATAAVAIALLVGLGAYMTLEGSGDSVVQDARPTATANRGARPAAEPEQTTGAGPVEPVAQQAPVVAPEPKAVAKRPEPKPRRVTGSDRIKIIGLLNNAKLALGDNRLMSPATDNAYDRYRKVLSLDPSNAKAKSGLAEIARRYVALANASIEGGNAAQAKGYLDRAKRADADSPGIPAAEARLSR